MVTESPDVSAQAVRSLFGFQGPSLVGSSENHHVRTATKASASRLAAYLAGNFQTAMTAATAYRIAAGVRNAGVLISMYSAAIAHAVTPVRTIHTNAAQALSQRAI